MGEREKRRDKMDIEQQNHWARCFDYHNGYCLEGLVLCFVVVVVTISLFMLIFMFVLKQRRRDVTVTRIHQSLLSPLLFQTLPHNNQDVFKLMQRASELGRGESTIGDQIVTQKNAKPMRIPRVRYGRKFSAQLGVPTPWASARDSLITQFDKRSFFSGQINLSPSFISTKSSSFNSSSQGPTLAVPGR